MPWYNMNMSKHASEVLRRLYDRVEARLGEVGQSAAVPKRAFLFASQMQPGVFDARKMEDADNLTYLYAAYLCLFGVVPGAEVIRMWTDAIEGLPPGKFRYRILNAIRSSREAKELGVTIVGFESVYAQGTR